MLVNIPCVKTWLSQFPNPNWIRKFACYVIRKGFRGETLHLNFVCWEAFKLHLNILDISSDLLNSLVCSFRVSWGFKSMFSGWYAFIRRDGHLLATQHLSPHPDRQPSWQLGWGYRAVTLRNQLHDPTSCKRLIRLRLTSLNLWWCMMFSKHLACRIFLDLVGWSSKCASSVCEHWTKYP